MPVGNGAVVHELENLEALRGSIGVARRQQPQEQLAHLRILRKAALVATPHVLDGHARHEQPVDARNLLLHRLQYPARQARRYSRR
eukprot:scaffold602_cov342-Prasinococcus_capsulatus_cf.AAC.12